jgi:hypothetical protein
MECQCERGYRLFPRPSLRLPAETNRVVQVKYTNPNDPHGSFKCAFLVIERSYEDTDMSSSSAPRGRTLRERGKSMLLIQENTRSFLPASALIDFVLVQRVTRRGMQMSSSSAPRGRANTKSFFFWIKSSARRAFGECLGSKRR